jgi:hypothetical protein
MPLTQHAEAKRVQHLARPSSYLSLARCFAQAAAAAEDTQTSSDEESEAEVEEEEQEESDDEFCDRTTAPVHKWEVLAGNRAVWVQLCQQLRLGQGSLG